MDELREEYKELFGKYPHHKAKEESVKQKIAAFKSKEVEVDSPPKPEVLETITLKDLKDVVKEPEPGQAEVVKPKVTSHPAGVPGREMFPLQFRGKAVTWSANTIESMSRTKAFRDQIVFPENSTFQHKANYNKCKSC